MDFFRNYFFISHFFVLPKVDYVLITSLFVCIKMITMLGVFPSFDEPYEVIVCNGTVWQRMVLFL